MPQSREAEKRLELPRSLDTWCTLTADAALAGFIQTIHFVPGARTARENRHPCTRHPPAGIDFRRAVGSAGVHGLE